MGWTGARVTGCSSWRGPTTAASWAAWPWSRSGEAALLRSLAVTAGARGHGLGSALVARALDRARAAGAHEAWLLTETAGPFFAARGWEAADRAAAPAGIDGSVEFTSACPSSVPAMRRAL